MSEGPFMIRDHRTAFRLGAISCIILLSYSLATILIVSLIGGPPKSAEECFSMLRENWINGLLRLDVLTVFVMPLYYVLFYAIYVSLKEIHYTLIFLSTLFIFVGVTLFLSAPSVYSFLSLSDAYWSATNEAEKGNFLSAAQALFATDIWHGTGPRIGGILGQTGATVLSVLMLKSDSFSRLTAYVGIATHGSDLIHMIVGFYDETIANGIMAGSGILYLVWFPMIAVALFKMQPFGNR